MIRIDRKNVQMPGILRRGVDGPADREFAQASAFYSDVETTRQRGGFHFKLYRHREVRDALERLFHGKCAYCETPIMASGRGDIEFFRPKAGVIAADGTHLPLHYWWLAAEWSNLYLSCIDCNRIGRRHNGQEYTYSGKGGRFPLADENLRAPLLTTGAKLDEEQPQLLDPCADDVETILLFTEDGFVQSTEQRGLVTIEIMGLNRVALVEARRQTATRLKTLLQLVFLAQDSADAQKINKSALADLKEMTSQRGAYAGLCRQLAATLLQGPDAQNVASYLADALTLKHTSVFTSAVQRDAKQALNQYQIEQENYSLEATPQSSLPAYLSARDRRVEHISIRNLRAIRKLDLSIVDPGGRASWLMLLGENAAGKSTVLQSLALALVGDRYRDGLLADLGLDLGSMVKAGADFGEVSVMLSGATEPRVLRISANGTTEVRGRDAQLMLLAYGSTRLLPRQKASASPGVSYARVDNLFDPFTPLIDAQSWLLGASQPDFDYAAIAIKKSLSVGLEQTLVREDGIVGLYERGILIPLSQLCDGYQTIIALVADILSIVLPAWKTPELAQGLVLIDEVGNHLHPSWKLRFVDSIREVLPGMQVIASTHEPLCLRGLKHGEVALLRRGPRGGISLVADLPPIDGMRIDQILTSEHFGLASTLDPSLQAYFDRYHALLRREAPTAEELEEMSQLRNEINHQQHLGQNERERRMLEAIDRFIARRVETNGTMERQTGEEALDAELTVIWEEANAHLVAPA